MREEQLLGYVLTEGETPPPPEEHREADGRRRMETRKPSPASSDSPGSPDSGGAPSGAVSGTTSPRVVATPEARRLAAEQGIDLSRVKGTGPSGPVVADVAARLHWP